MAMSIQFCIIAELQIVLSRKRMDRMPDAKTVFYSIDL